ncbi:hypothetical protein [Bacteroides eggerthii]|uniref:hypothetical protein n=1 Tax=Bacteroides eggerthii TaxID=28111 RepID=UPI00293D6E14|nr:hypothetical protein [Bacteroides eggerthii]
MRLKLYTLLCISFLLIFTACNQDDDPVPAEKVTRTVLAYIMADNSLSGFASIDIDEMMKGMEAVDASLYNLLFMWMTRAGRVPSLISFLRSIVCRRIKMEMW